ncbi:hypothetical protein [Methanocalculus sp. MC3]
MVSLFRFPVIAVLVLLCIASGCVQPDMVLPSISPAQAESPALVIDHTFPFEESEITISLPLDSGVYYGARDADKQIYLYTDLTDRDWLPHYYRAFIDDPHQEEFFLDLIEELRRVRSDLQLDDDRYLELCCVFVQSLPYDDDTVLIEPKFPIETYGDGTGDCDDKSLLLAGILSREEYSVALLLYSEEAHMAVGVKGDGCRDIGDGYVFIETTRSNFVGIVPEMLAGDIVLESDPLIIPIGDGTIRYGRCDQTIVLSDLLTYCRDEIDRLNAEMERESVLIREMNDDIGALRREMDILIRQGRYQEYNRQVPVFNSLIDRYNKRIEEYNRLVRSAERYVAIHTTLINRMYDRYGLYSEMLKEGIIAELRSGI